MTLVDQWPEHVEALKARGLRLSGTCGDHHIPVRALHIHELQGVRRPFDAVFVAVKSYDTEWATELGLRWLTPDGVVVDFQNGVNDERVAALAGRGRALGCVILIGAGMYGPAHAMRTDSGTIGFKVGEHDGSDPPRAGARARDQRRRAVRPHHEPVGRAVVEALRELHGESARRPLGVRLRRGALAPAPSRICVHIAAEVVAVGRARGFEVEPIYGIEAERFVAAAKGRDVDAVLADMAGSAKHLTGGRSSFLQDVMKRRRTEIDYLNGYVCAEGRRLGVPTPVNDAVVAEVRRHGVGKLEPHPKNLEPILAVLSV